MHLNSAQTLTNKTLGTGTKVNIGEASTGVGDTGIDLNLANGLNHKVTLTGDGHLRMINALAGAKYLVRVVQGDGSGHNPTFAGETGVVKWTGGTAPTWTSGSGAVDIVTFYYNGEDFYAVGNTDFKVAT